MSLSTEQIGFFAENGYLPYANVLGEDDLDLLRREYDREFERARDEGSYRNLAVGDAVDIETRRSSPGQMLQIMQLCERNIHFRRLLYNPEILDVVQGLIGPNIMLFHDQALFKPAYTGGPVLWHQDNAYWRCRPANLVSCWLTLDDVDRENGAMHLLPGSHVRLLQHERSTETDALLDIGKQIDESRAVAVELPAGACMFHHCQTLHYTPPNRTERQRRAFAIHFLIPGTRGGNGEVLHPGFHRPVLRMEM